MVHKGGERVHKGRKGFIRGILGDSYGKESPAMRETWVQSLGWEDPLEKETATHSSILGLPVAQTVKNPHAMRETWV